jgi:hypothetical protein
MLHVPWESLGGFFIIGLVCRFLFFLISVRCIRRAARGVGPLKAIIKITPWNLCRVPSTVTLVSWRLRRGTLITTELV